MDKKKKKILLVEDDPFLVDIYTTKLKESGFFVESVSDGEMVIEKLNAINPDLVLLDIVLPKIDGWELLRMIRSDEKNKNLKIIILSNLGQREEVEKGVNLGAVKYLIKAYYSPSQVVKEIKKIWPQ